MLPSKYSPHNTQNFFVHLLRFLPLALIFEDISKIVHAAECLDAPLPELGASLSALLCSCPQLPAISIVKDSREVVHGSAPPDAPLRMAISTSLCISSASCHLPWSWKTVATRLLLLPRVSTWSFPKIRGPSILALLCASLQIPASFLVVGGHWQARFCSPKCLDAPLQELVAWFPALLCSSPQLLPTGLALGGQWQDCFWECLDGHLQKLGAYHPPVVCASPLLPATCLAFEGQGQGCFCLSMCGCHPLQSNSNRFGFWQVALPSKDICQILNAN